MEVGGVCKWDDVKGGVGGVFDGGERVYKRGGGEGEGLMAVGGGGDRRRINAEV
nr:hypothetical protein [Bacillus subtilis]